VDGALFDFPPSLPQGFYHVGTYSQAFAGLPYGPVFRTSDCETSPFSSLQAFSAVPPLILPESGAEGSFPYFSFNIFFSQGSHRVAPRSISSPFDRNEGDNLTPFICSLTYPPPLSPEAIGLDETCFLFVSLWNRFFFFSPLYWRLKSCCVFPRFFDFCPAFFPDCFLFFTLL